MLPKSNPKRASAARAVAASLVAVVSTTASGTRTLTAGAPCHIVASYYPTRDCRVSDDATECRVAPNAFGSREACCRSFGQDGCTPTGDTECFTAGSRYPTTNCIATNDPEVCNLKHSQWATLEECCEPGKAFTQGCNWQYSVNRDVAESCWIASTFYPQRECYEVTDASICQRGWGSWLTYHECCAPNAAHADGCGFAA